MNAPPFDEGFTDDDSHAHSPTVIMHPSGCLDGVCRENNGHERSDLLTSVSEKSVHEREELAYRLLASLPRSRLASLQRRITPLLQFDVVGSLPTELALQLFSHLPAQTLLQCALVCRRWRALADDPVVWKNLCDARGWEWSQPSRAQGFESMLARVRPSWDDSDDEGMGDSDEEVVAGGILQPATADDDDDMQALPDDSGIASTSMSFHLVSPNVLAPLQTAIRPFKRLKARARHSAPSVLPCHGSSSTLPKPNYKLLYQTHMRLHNRFLSGSYRLSALQTRGAPPTNTHTSTIYCLQLYTYPTTGVQVLFTGSRDRSIREWNLGTGSVERVIGGVHESSVLSICAYNGLIASAGSDRRVALWDLAQNKLVKLICDHEDSVLCVRFDNERLVSCSKDRTVRTYLFPDLKPQFVLGTHRAAVNAVSISHTLIVSGSGDRSIRLWDAQTGALLRKFEDHHTRGIASIDFRPPYVLSGSSDKHLRLFDITTLQGWSTSPESERSRRPSAFPFRYDLGQSAACQTCGHVSGDSDSTGFGGGGTRAAGRGERIVHSDLVRSVALGDDLVLSGSYDLSIKVWDRRTGAIVADLTGGHTGRIFCIGFDCTKIVSCGEDQNICIWDFSHGLDTSFLKL